MKIARLVFTILLIFITFLFVCMLIGKANNNHYWIGDEAPEGVSAFSRLVGNFFKSRYEDIYENGGDGTGDTTGVVDSIMETADKVVDEANKVIDASGGVFDDAGNFIQKASGMFGSAGGLLEEAFANLKETYPDLHINLPQEDAPTVTPDPNYNYAEVPGMTVEFIDVGQADCILVYSQENTMLIDAGNNEDGPLVVDYLCSIGIDHFNYVIGTHAHEDHIGGLDDVIKAFKVDNIILPLVSSDTMTYSSVLSAAAASDAQTITPKAGDSYSLGYGKFTILACDPVTDETNLNESSIVIKLLYGDSSFLFTGDAEKENEEDMLNRKVDLDCDVLKVGHHGSYTSSSEEFIAEVSPAISIISCGTDNDYGHPHEVTMETLDNADTAIFRTDLSGTIRINTSGQEYDISTVATNTDGTAD